MTLLAVYGTLRRGENGFVELGLAKRMRFVGACKLRGILFDYGPYPALAEGEGVVVGELYDVKLPGVLAAIDAFEAFDPKQPRRNMFVRREVELIEPHLLAFAYFVSDSVGRGPRSARWIGSGDWRRRW